MRRLYESSAVKRDDDDPTKPAERRDDPKPEAMRSVPAKGISDLLIPKWISRRGIQIRVSTGETEYAQGEQIPFEVVMKNTYPFPVTLKTASPIYWTWDVDGHVEASKVPIHTPPDRHGEFVFDRGERKIFSRSWDQMFQVSETEWVEAAPGEYTIRAAINLTESEIAQRLKRGMNRLTGSRKAGDPDPPEDVPSTGQDPAAKTDHQSRESPKAIADQTTIRIR